MVLLLIPSLVCSSIPNNELNDFVHLVGLEETCHVLKDDQSSEIFSAVLGMVDITRGTNSYYKIQLLEEDTNEKWFVFRA